MVRVAKPWLICGYYGLTNVTVAMVNFRKGNIISNVNIFQKISG